MLRFSEVSWSAGDVPILGGIDLTVRAGELVALIGPSGVGKSTMLRLAAGILAPNGGVVTNTARRTAMVFQEPRLLPWESARDNVGLALTAQGIGRAAARAEADAWLLRLGFHRDDLGKRPMRLSGGMKARVAVARAFVGAPDLVLLDEPFAALDLGLRRDLQALTRALVEETGVGALFVTHDLTEAVRLADRIVVLSGRPARIVAEMEQSPVAALPDVWRAAAELAHRAELAPVLRGLAGAADAPLRR